MTQTLLARAAVLAALLPLAAPAQVSDWCDAAPVLQLNRITPQWLDAGVHLADGGTATVNTNAAQLTTDGGAAACFANFSDITNIFQAGLGRDTAWSFTAPAAGTYSFRAAAPAAATNTVLYLTNSCQPVSYEYGAAECIAAVNHVNTTGTGPEELSCVTLSDAQSVFLWVDEAAPSAAGTNLMLEVSSCYPEAEPNDTPAQANAVSCAVTGGIRDAGDVDFYALGTLPAGARVFALAEAAASTAADFDLRVTTADTTLEFDNYNAAALFGETSGLVAGTLLPAAPSYLRVNYSSPSTRAEPYMLYTHVEVGEPTPEVEPNNSVLTANTDTSQYFSGFAGDAGDVDFFSVQANAGDVIFAALDSVPDFTDAGTTVGNLNFNLALFDGDGGLLLDINDGSAAAMNLAFTPGGGLTGLSPSAPAEGFVWRARASGTYTVRVGKTNSFASAYLLSMSVGCVPGGITVTDITPLTGTPAGGTTVTLTGTGFSQNSQVFIGGKRATRVSNTATELVVLTPSYPGDGPQPLVVTDGVGLPSYDDVFTYVDPAGTPPTLVNVSPLHVPSSGGTTITLTGTVFRDNVAVFIDGIAATNVTRLSTTQVTATTPPHAEGAVDVRVQNVDSLEATLTAGLIYDGPPTVTSVTPAAGSSLGGTAVTVSGTNLRPGTRLFFAGQEATVSAIAPDGLSLTATTPFSVVDGAVDVSALTTDGQTGTLPGGFTFTFAPPTLASISPLRGFAVGGATVTLTGTGLRPGVQVNFIVNSVSQSATNVTVGDGGTSLTASTPAHVPGLADVEVINTDTQSATLPGSYRYDGAPVVTSITPSTGLTTGGTAVTITGQEFRPDAGVFFGATAATAISVASDGLSITANTPAATLNGPVNVRIRNTDTQEIIVDGGFVYAYPAPTLVTVSPTRGYETGNTLVTLTGTGFLTTPQTPTPPTVTIGGAPATSVTRVSSTTITARTPAGVAGPAAVVVTNGDGQSATLPTGFTYDPSPTFASVTPDHGPAQGGTRITITGTNFVSGATVSIGGVPTFAVAVASSTSLSATTIAQPAGVWPITITNPDGQVVTSAAVFTVNEAPALQSLSPFAGVKEGGTTVTLTGTGFLAGAQVLFGGLDGTGVTVTSSTSLTVTTPAHAVGLVPVIVRNPDGQSISVPRAYQYVDAPTLLSVNPEGGDVAGGESVHIYGAGFASGATVAFGGVAAPEVTYLTSGELLALAPPHEPGAVDVTVSTQGLTLTLASAYTYSRGQPVVSALSPITGPVEGGTQLSIVGAGFLPGATVSVGGQTVTPVTVVSGTLLRVTTQAHAAGVVDITVTNTDGQSGTLAAAFTYAEATPPIDDTLRDGGSGTVGTPPDYTPTPGGVSCGCSSFDGSLSFAALGLLTLLSRRRRSR